MAEARLEQDWNHTSAILAVLVNTHRDPKRRAVRPDEFHPLRSRSRRTGTRITRDTIGLLKVFVPTDRPKGRAL